MDRKNNTKNLVCIGKIVSAHGVKGLLKIQSHTEVPENLISYGKIYNHNGSKTFDIILKSKHKDLLIVSIEDVVSRDDAEKLKGIKLYIEREALPQESEDEYYITDLVGMNVYDISDHLVGKVKAVQNFGGGDILEIEFLDAKKTEFLSFTKENFPEVNISDNKIKLRVKIF